MPERIIQLHMLVTESELETIQKLATACQQGNLCRQTHRNKANVSSAMVLAAQEMLKRLEADKEGNS